MRWMAQHLSEVLIMVTVGGLIAFILDPLITRIARHMPRLAAIAVTYLGLVAVLTVALVLIIPEIIHQLRHMDAAIRSGEFSAHMTAVFGQASDYFHRLPEPVREQLVKLQGTLSEVGNEAMATFFGALAGVLGWMAKGMIILVLSIYIAMDKRLIRDFLLSLVPIRARSDAVVVVGEVLDVIRAYLRGQIVVIGFVAVSVTLVLLIFQIPYALTIGTFAGILEVIPYFGAVAGAVPAVILGFLKGGWVMGALLILFFVVINQLEGHVVIPWVMGHAMEMRPLVVLLSLLVGAELYGIVGLIVAVPLCRIVQVLVEHGLRLYKEAQVRELTVVTETKPPDASAPSVSPETAGP